MKTKDGRAIAHDNEVRVLRALHRFGWLRTRDLAALVWQRWQARPLGEPEFMPPMASDSGLRMAQRTTCRLFKARQLLRGQAPLPFLKVPIHVSRQYALEGILAGGA